MKEKGMERKEWKKQGSGKEVKVNKGKKRKGNTI